MSASGAEPDAVVIDRAKDDIAGAALTRPRSVTSRLEEEQLLRWQR